MYSIILNCTHRNVINTFGYINNLIKRSMHIYFNENSSSLEKWNNFPSQPIVLFYGDQTIIFMRYQCISNMTSKKFPLSCDSKIDINDRQLESVAINCMFF